MRGPKLEIRSDVEIPYWFVRIQTSVIDSRGAISRKRKVHILGDVCDTPRAVAEKARIALLCDSPAQKANPKSEFKFADLVARYYELRLPQLGSGSQARYRVQIDKHLLPMFGSWKLSEIDDLAVEKLVALKMQSGMAPATIQSIKNCLSTLYSAARQWRLHTGTNPTTGVRIRKRAVREKRLLTQSDFVLIRSMLREREQFLLDVLYGTGLRISEALGLKFSDIDIERGTLTVKRRWYRGDISEATKTAASARRVILPDALIARVRTRYTDADSFVFAENDELPPDDRDLLRYEIRPLLKRLKLYYPGFGFHSFRRANITHRQTIGGATALESMRAAGHTKVDMTLAYTLLDPEREREQVNRMFSRIA